MPGNSSYETSWADQWDPEPMGMVPAKKSSGGGSPKLSKKLGDGFGKTKEAASSGMKKVKAGTSLGLQWVKDKYHKTTHKR